jgi:hypothetical protein
MMSADLNIGNQSEPVESETGDSSNILISPKLKKPLADGEIASIGIFGGSGIIGLSLIRTLAQQGLDIPLYFHARSSEGALKITCALHDNLAPSNMKMTTSALEVRKCDLVIMCAGLKTTGPGPNKKKRLLEGNLRIVEEYLSGTSAKAILLVTNPTTELVKTLMPRTSTPLFGIGVENDARRFRFHGNRAESTFLVGAHHFAELMPAYGSGKDVRLEKSPFNLSVYKEISDRQDSLLAVGATNELLDELRGLPSDVRWWASQRLNTIVNGTTDSCVAAISDFINVALFGVGQVTVETQFEIHGRSYVLGWPVSHRLTEALKLEVGKEHWGELQNLFALAE